jgi:hypothetical protein
LRPDLAVEAVVHGQDGTRTTLWMLLDSGASIGLLPAAVAADLHLVEARRATLIAINGVARTSVVVVPRLELGDLGVSSVAFLVNTLAGPAAEIGLIGQSVLSRMPWEISWDRGIVTLGTQPWPDGPDVSTVPLEPFPNGGRTAGAGEPRAPRPGTVPWEQGRLDDAVGEFWVFSPGDHLSCPRRNASLSRMRRNGSRRLTTNGTERSSGSVVKTRRLTGARSREP